MLSISIEKQRKRPPFFIFGLGKEMLTILEILFGGRQTETYFRIVYLYCLKCFRIILKSTGNAGLFSNFVILLMCPCGRTWRHSRVGGRVWTPFYQSAEYAQKIRYDTIRFVLFTFLTKQALCQHRISTLTQSDMGRQGGAWRNIGKNEYEMKGCCKCPKTAKQLKTHRVKPYVTIGTLK